MRPLPRAGITVNTSRSARCNRCVDVWLRNVDRRVLTGRWAEPGDIAKFKGINGSDSRPRTNATSRFVMDNNEFRLTSANLSYRLSAEDHKFLRSIGMKSATVAVYCDDLLRLSTVRMERGIDYPFARTVSMSLNLTF